MLAALLALGIGLALGGCARVSGRVQAVAGAGPLPEGVTWTAVPGPGVGKDDAASLELVAEALAPRLARHGWTRLPAGAGEKAGVLVRIWWETAGPAFSGEAGTGMAVGAGTSFSRAYGTVGFGHAGWYGPFAGFRPGRAGRAFWGGFPCRIRAVYTHTLAAQALDADTLPPSLREALSPRPASPAASASDAFQGTDADADAGPDPALPPYAPPLLPASAGTGTAADVPASAVLWEARVTNTGSRNNTVALLPYLAAALAGAAGQDVTADVVVNGDLKVKVED